jgi:hypothetical protein
VTEQERQELIEQVAGAWRPDRLDGGVGSLPAWHDLDEASRIEAFELAQTLRTMESALHPDGLSSTARSVLARLQR